MVRENDETGETAGLRARYRPHALSSPLASRPPGLSPRLKLLILGAVAGVLTAGWWVHGRPSLTRTESGPIDVGGDPIQIEVADLPAIPWRGGNADLELRPVAAYSIGAMVVHSKSYWWGWQGDLSPIDLSLVWGDMVKPEFDSHIHYTQHFRYTLYVYDGQAPFSDDYALAHASNHHLIPATPNVLKALRSLGKKQTIRLNGYLVNVEGKVKGEPVWWRSSLVRNDTGEGACELLYVKSVRVDGKVYE